MDEVSHRGDEMENSVVVAEDSEYEEQQQAGYGEHEEESRQIVEGGSVGEGGGGGHVLPDASISTSYYSDDDDDIEEIDLFCEILRGNLLWVSLSSIWREIRVVDAVPSHYIMSIAYTKMTTTNRGRWTSLPVLISHPIAWPNSSRHSAT